MKQNFGLTLGLAAIAVFFLGCNTQPNTSNATTDATPASSPTPTNTASPPQASEEIKVASSSSTYELLKVLSDAYAKKEENSKINLLPPSQSEGAIAGVKDGILAVGAISRPLKPEEEDGSIVYQEIARDALLVAARSDVQDVSDLETAQLQGIYSGAIENWEELGGPEATILVLDRPEDESAKRLLRQHYLGKDLQNSPNAVVLRKEGELIDAIQSTPYSIGAFSLAYSIRNQLPINPLSLDGVAPTQDNVEAGKYKMVRQIGIIYPQSPSEETQKFIDFIFSEEASKRLRREGFVPSQKNDRKTEE